MIPIPNTEGEVLGVSNSIAFDCDTGSATNTSFNLNASNLTPGTYGANELDPNYLNSDPVQVTSSGYIKADVNDNTVIARTKSCGDDMEVDSWVSYGYTYARVNNDRGFFLHHDARTSDGEVRIGYTDTITDGFKDWDQLFYSSTNAADEIPGYVKNDDTARFTLGVNGTEIYAKYNGVEFFRSPYNAWLQLEPGYAAIKAGATYGHRMLNVDFKAREKAYYSDLENNEFNALDFGFKDLQTTGSISAGSNVLSLTSNPGFEVGDHIVIEVGGEAGGGLRGSRDGVGGYWPGRSYQTVAEAQADRPNINEGGQIYAYIEEIDQVVDSYSNLDYWRTPDASNNALDPYKYYEYQPVPLALKAKVISVNGSQLTLDTSALNSTSAANVYVDNRNTFFVTDIINDDNSSRNENGNITAILPTGTFYLSDDLRIGTDRDNFKLIGQGKYLSILSGVEGSVTPEITTQGNRNLEFRDFSIIGTIGDNGYVGNDSREGLDITHAAGSIVSDIRCIDVPNSCVDVSSNDVWAYRIEDFTTEPLRTYFQWKLQWADGEGGGCVDCRIIGTSITPGFEFFGHKKWRIYTSFWP
jgi:hypothetical protein